MSQGDDIGWMDGKDDNKKTNQAKRLEQLDRYFKPRPTRALASFNKIVNSRTAKVAFRKQKNKKNEQRQKQIAERTSLAVGLRECTERQKLYLRALVQYEFNSALAIKAMRATGDRLDRSTVERWLRTNEVFIRTYHAIKADARAQVVDKDKLIMNAEAIRVLALKPKPILFKGQDTGFKEQNLDTALRANELLMKTQKMLGNDQETQTTGTGPALIIQIVQGENKVVDVSSGVTIDLPSPEDAS